MTSPHNERAGERQVYSDLPPFAVGSETHSQTYFLTQTPLPVRTKQHTLSHIPISGAQVSQRAVKRSSTDRVHDKTPRG